MSKRFILSIFSCATLALTVLAHEFWIEPSHARVKVGDRLALNIMVGENFKGERWQGKGDRITLYKHLFEGGAHDLLNSIDVLSVAELHDFTPVTEGTHVLALETNHSYIELEPDEFEAYLREDGLTEALEYRQQNGEQLSKGRERYKRCAKVIIQAGEESDQAFKSTAYTTLEIIPKEDPYKDNHRKPATFEIYFKEKPLPNAKVRCWWKNGENVEVQIQTSSKKGEVSFQMDTPGLYMISVVNMIRIQGDPKADWESTWGTLIFGIGDQ